MGEVQAPSQRGPSSRQLAAEAVVQVGGLLGQEVALAKAELRAHGRHLGMGGAMLATASFLGVTAWLILLAGAIAGISVALPVWAAALIVGGVLALAGGTVAALGGRRVARGLPPFPATAQSVRRDFRELKEKARR